MDKIAIIDMGGQYCHLLARRIRQLNVYSEIVPNTISAYELKKEGYKGIILSGGPSSVYDKKSPRMDKQLLELDIPILGLCYSHQRIAMLLGSEVKPGKTKEYGTATMTVKDTKDLFAGLEKEQTVWMSHWDTVYDLPEGFRILGSTPVCEIAAMGSEEKQIYGLQFHPEVTHTPNGMKILENFAVNICKCKKEWSIKDFAGQKIKEIQETVGKKKVFLLVSGGVDSMVCFSLLNKALGEENVYGLHIDNGLMRKNESRKVEEKLKELGFNNFHVADYADEFVEKLKNIYDPEDKRKIIGTVFIDVYRKETEKLNLNPEDWILAQGTIYPDTIETQGTENADLIKTHHNRVEAVQKLIDEGKVIEPIKLLYKDEVRELGEELGLPKALVYRHPFPGPGLAVRCLCAEKEYSVESEKEINEKLNKITSKYNLKARVLPIKSVGVQGDFRSYKHPALIMGNADWKTLEKVSTEITNSVNDINRVVWSAEDISNISLKKAYITGERLSLLKEADDIVMITIREKNLYDNIWQFPVILVPLTTNSGEIIVLRPVTSTEAMTARFGELPMSAVNEIKEKLLSLNSVDAVLYDITNKPPGTIEWE